MTEFDVNAHLEAARAEPESVETARLVDALDADDGTSRALALRALAHVARSNPDEVAEHADAVRAALDDGYPVAEGDAALVCAELARDRPELVRPVVPRLVGMLTEIPPRKGYRAVSALVPVLDSDPRAFVPEADALVDALADPPSVDVPTGDELADLPDGERQERVERLSARRDQIQQDRVRTFGIREFAAHALVEVAESDPTTLADRVDDLAAGLAAEPAAARVGAADALATVASADSAAVEPVVDDLIDALDADGDGVQVYAVRALGHAGASEAIDSLRRLAAADVDPQLATLAAETADFLAETEQD
ncbi:hypothetical protein [Halosimplex salinum]|uniref:hypothetical protein n=1 Tax=Halosimplex salinum TaxID=1710538 RepID=UPI000F460D54|nr:hypothetical protein [Halosimplex salinum]